MKKLLFRFMCAVCIAAVMLFAGCAAGDDVGDVPVPQLFGSYWGTVNVLGSHNMCLVIRQNSVSIHSDIMGRTYPNIKYTNNGDGTWLVSCYNAADNKRLAIPRLTAEVNLTANPVFCKPKITAMSFASFSDCPKGIDYDGRFAN